MKSSDSTTPVSARLDSQQRLARSMCLPMVADELTEEEIALVLSDKPAEELPENLLAKLRPVFERFDLTEGVSPIIYN